MSNPTHIVCSAMELPDIHVRVLFDFEYKTKDGIEVKIKEGERLYLIKRTNQDWWQVIRNSGRPFYVPTTYVEEIPRTNTTLSESDATTDGMSLGKQKNEAIENYRMRSCSVESQQTHENHKVKPTVPKRTIFDTNAKRILVSPPVPVAPLKSKIPSEKDEDNHAVYVNLSKQHADSSSSENLAHKDDLAIKNNVDRLIENISNNLMSVDDEYLNGYSHVAVRTCSLSKGYEGQLSNLSNSLEELTQQIELKAKIIGTAQKPSSPKELAKTDQSVTEAAVQPKGLNQTGSFRQLYESPRRHQEDKNKLQYSGSFKTKHECERMTKNYMLLSSMREEESGSVAESSKKDRVNGKLNDDNNNSKKIALKDSTSKMLSEEDGSDKSSNVTNEDISISLETPVSPDRVTLYSTSEQNNVKLSSRLKHSFDSSGEDSDKHASYVNSRLTLSDKGSTDSLLDVDTHYSIQEGSVCTTASDSLLQTSDTSEECLPSILRDELSPEDVGLRKKAALKRNNRVEYRARYPIKSVSPPIPEENQAPTRELFDDWCEYSFIDGRIFFYNSKTGEKSWKPPRRRCNTDEKTSRLDGSTSNLCSGSSSPFGEIDDNAASLGHSDIMVPIGWRLETDHENGCQCYININTGAKLQQGPGYRPVKLDCVECGSQMAGNSNVVVGELKSNVISHVEADPKASPNFEYKSKTFNFSPEKYDPAHLDCFSSQNMFSSPKTICEFESAWNVTYFLKNNDNSLAENYYEVLTPAAYLDDLRPKLSSFVTFSKTKSAVGRTRCDHANRVLDDDYDDGGSGTDCEPYTANWETEQRRLTHDVIISNLSPHEIIRSSNSITTAICNYQCNPVACVRDMVSNASSTSPVCSSIDCNISRNVLETCELNAPQYWTENCGDSSSSADSFTDSSDFESVRTDATSDLEFQQLAYSRARCRDSESRASEDESNFYSMNGDTDCASLLTSSGDEVYDVEEPVCRTGADNGKDVPCEGGSNDECSSEESEEVENLGQVYPTVDIMFRMQWASRHGMEFSDLECWLRHIYLAEYTHSDEEHYPNLMENKWFSSNDEEGRVYYFEENSSESSWTLPTQMTASSSEKLEDHCQPLGNDHIYSNVPMGSQSRITSNELNLSALDRISSNNNRISKSKSMILIDNKNEDPPAPVPFSLKNWPQLSDGRMCILKEGTLNKSKITEHGKRLRKNWSTSHVVLTELFLLFFKDSKSFNAMQKPGAAHRPEMSVDLNGALIDRGDKVSSRKNVYIISTVLGLQVLIQHDCTQEADNWLLAIQSAIKNLPSGFDSCPRLTRGHVNAEETVPDTESKKSNKVTRTKSVKAKNKDGSIEDLAVSSAERQTKIKARLKKFFHRRPTMELLVKKGIYRDEPAFGCYLDKVVTSESPKVPLFVQRCISCIEKSEENMKTDGLYRASGNLSQVQKIRLQVDQNNLSVIENEEDVHVLTGALKLFFRELKEPLIPYHLFHKAIKASHNSNKKEKNSQFREITKALPPANYDTLKFLLQHLLKVTKYKEFNRMHIPNLAIVFGPTLMWPEQESNNMALDLMQQNLVIECLLLEYDNIFR